MQYILSGTEHKNADNQTSALGIPSMVLMERASLAVVDQLLEDGYDLNRVLVVCGSGNNGGDGVCVARLLSEMGYVPTVYLAGKKEKYTEQLVSQLHILESYPANVLEAYDEAGSFTAPSGRDWEGYSLIMDAVFGIGLTREVTGAYAEVIQAMNDAGRPIVAIDMPSGVHTDTGKVMGVAVNAELTVTMTCGKAGLYLYPGVNQAGRVVIKKIGIPLNEENAGACKLFALGDEDWKAPVRNPAGNKGTFGKILVIAGSGEICGAAYLSSKAALLCGAGMVKIYTHEANRASLAVLLPEALLSVYKEEGWKRDRLLKDLDWADAVLIGPGLGTDKTALAILTAFLDYNCEKKLPAVFDADALNLLAEHRDLLGKINFPVTVTPHIGEMSRLSGISIPDIKSRLVPLAKTAAMESGMTVLLKDAVSVTALPDGSAYLNLSGCSALATAGSGDVLAGMVTTLTLMENKGQLEAPAAALAAFLHGKCGELAAERYSEASVTAVNLLEFIHTFF